MTRPFSPRQKYRILVAHDAVVIWNDELVTLPRFHWMTMSETKRFGILRRFNCAVRCACGCDTWAPLREIDFDHVKEFVSGGETAIRNGAPLRRSPCHAKKTASSAATTGWVRRTKRKLSVTAKRDDDSPVSESTARTVRRSWPTRSLTDPIWKRCFGGVVERRA